MTEWSTLTIRVARGDGRAIQLTPEKADAITWEVSHALASALCDDASESILIDTITMMGAEL